MKGRVVAEVQNRFCQHMHKLYKQVEGGAYKEVKEQPIVEDFFTITGFPAKRLEAISG